MEHAAVVGEYAIIVLVGGWPLFLIGSIIVAAHLWSIREVSRSRVVCAVAFAWPFAVVVTLVVWRWWPLSFGGPMWGPYFHGPALLASVVVFSLAAWWARMGAPHTAEARQQHNR